MQIPIDYSFQNKATTNAVVRKTSEQIHIRMWKQICWVITITFISVFMIVPFYESVELIPANEVVEVEMAAINKAPRLSGRSESVDRLLSQAVNDGAILAQCFRNKCYDTSTAQYIGEGADGYYILYPKKDQQGAKKVKEMAGEIKRLSKIKAPL